MAGTAPAGTRTAVPNVNGPFGPEPDNRVSVTVYDWMITLSSGLGAVIVGFLRLLRRVTQATVVVVWVVEEVTLETIAVPSVENPSTVMKTNALPLCPEPPSQPARRATRHRALAT
jgi:hypothetical protein